MSRVLVTGGAGTIGTAIVKRLLSDPAYDVRVSDARPVPLWMREGCELHTGDLRLPAQARAATKGCAHVIHLAGAPGGIAAAREQPHTAIEFESALHGAVVRAALERDVERFLYVSSSLVFERATLFPTPEQHLAECPAPRSATGFARLSGERVCEAAHREHRLSYTICRPFGSYGCPTTDERESETEALVAELIDAALGTRPPELGDLARRTCTPTYADDIAAGIVLALGSPGALNDDFNLGAARELELGELARLVYEACEADPATLAPALRVAAPKAAASAKAAAAPKAAAKSKPAAKPKAVAEKPQAAAASRAEPERVWPSVEKAHEVLGWEAQTGLEQGLAATVRALRERHSAAQTVAAVG
jgi:UDP-glucose 4-epimerase